ncbi:MAG: radical SAM protein, partial [Oscillospiraceae bacterium]
MAVKISAVKPFSKCFLYGIRSGDLLLSIDDKEIVDVLDYDFYLSFAPVTMKFKTKSGKQMSIKINNEDTGLSFDTFLMDNQHSCKNKCVFCFIDQMPKGMRKSLYFKDDDSRLSFLFGNYITLTNITEHEIERIISMHISPVNISVHTMNPVLRAKMMNNKNAGTALSIIKRFADAEIKINTQLVLCPEINDG